MENPMNKMFNGHKYNKNDIKPESLNANNDMDIEELEQFYKRVRDTQIHDIRELISKHHCEASKYASEILKILNESDNREIVTTLNKSLINSKKEILEAINTNSITQNQQSKRLDTMEKTIFILLLVVVISLIPNIIIILKYIVSLITVYLQNIF